MKALYEGIKSSSMAYLSIHELPLELQLPPKLDSLLHSEEDVEQDIFYSDPKDEAEELWGPDMSFGWQPPALTPWKSLLLLDDLGTEEGQEAFANLRSPYITPDDRPIVKGLVRFGHRTFGATLVAQPTLAQPWRNLGATLAHQTWRNLAQPELQ